MYYTCTESRHFRSHPSSSLTLIIFRPPAMTAMVLCLLLGSLLYLLNAVPPTVLVLASLLLLCIIAKCQRKSGRLQMLIVTHFICLAPIFSGFSCLLLWPSLCMSLAFSLWLLRSVSFLLATKVQSIVTRQFLVCFQARGAPGEGQGDPGARRRPEDPGNVLKPIGNLWKTSAKAI